MDRPCSMGILFYVRWLWSIGMNSTGQSSCESIQALDRQKIKPSESQIEGDSNQPSVHAWPYCPLLPAIGWRGRGRLVRAITGRLKPDVLDCSYGLEQALLQLLHQIPMQQLTSHVHHRSVPRQPLATDRLPRALRQYVALLAKLIGQCGIFSELCRLVAAVEAHFAFLLVSRGVVVHGGIPA